MPLCTPYVQGVIRPGLSLKKKSQCAAVTVCSAIPEIGIFQMSAVPLENSEQDKSDTSGLLENCLQLFPLFPFPFLWVHEVGLKMRSSAGLDAA